MKGLMKSQRRKFLKLFPEKEKKRLVRIEGSAEADKVTVIDTETRGKKVIKEYTIGKPLKSRPALTPEELVARFKLQKELYSKGYPVVRPIRIFVDKKKGKVYWEEEFVGMRTYEDIERWNPAIRKVSGKSLPELKQEYEKAARELERFSEKENLAAVVSPALAELIMLRDKNLDFDLKKSNAVWDPEKKRFVFTDLYLYRPEKRKNP